MSVTKLEYANPTLPFRTLINIPISQVYGCLLNQIYYLLAKEVSAIIGGYKDWHVNSELAIKKRLMKTPKSLLTKAKPFLLFNSSINYEAEGGAYGGMGFISSDFDTDIVDPLSNMIFMMNDRSDINKNLKVSLLFSEHELNVECNVVTDSRQTIVNLHNDWNMMRTLNLPDYIEMVLKLPLSEVLIEEICNLLNIKDMYSNEALKAIKKYSEDSVVFEKDTSTGNSRYFLKYVTPVIIIPTTPNIANGALESGVMKNAILTRPFTVKFNAPTKIHIDTYTNRLKLRLIEKPDYTIEIEGGMSGYYKNLDWEKDDKTIVFSGIKEQKKEVEELSILDAIKSNPANEALVEFIKWVQDNKGNPDKFYALRIQNKDETDYAGVNTTFDKNTLKIIMKEEPTTKLTFTFYVYKAAWMDFKRLS